jgi:hypothetical protein
MIWTILETGGRTNALRIDKPKEIPQFWTGVNVPRKVSNGLKILRSADDRLARLSFANRRGTFRAVAPDLRIFRGIMHLDALQ